MLDAIVDVEDRYQVLLRRWLDWAPPNNSLPTLSALVHAIRVAGMESLADELEKLRKTCVLI